MNIKILLKISFFFLISFWSANVSAQDVVKEQNIKWYIDYDLKTSACKDEKSAHPFCAEWKEYGLCEDEYDRAIMEVYCQRTCAFCSAVEPPKCLYSEYGCCWDWEKEALSPDGDGCPRCRDEFRTLCKRFRSQCEKQGKNGEYIRRKCGKTCGFCRKDMMVIDEATFNRHRTKLQ
uniref:Toxin candidate TRINITY_DN20808_c2_g7_i3 n=1 Tax=Ceriantheomorphe brasiliensis TaxID=1048506 RepID=A0A7G7WZ31_9CNID|nr:toxin candidate TRINITY_DN20808_c2_g7_i3 [Ceriantheomorphe brasiliensis]